MFGTDPWAPAAAGLAAARALERAGGMTEAAPTRATEVPTAVGARLDRMDQENQDIKKLLIAQAEGQRVAEETQRSLLAWIGNIVNERR